MRSGGSGAAVRAHGESEAERIIRAVGDVLGLPQTEIELRTLRKSDPRKIICATLVKQHTAMDNAWLAKRLCMGHLAAMSQLVNRRKGVRKGSQEKEKGSVLVFQYFLLTVGWFSYGLRHG